MTRPLPLPTASAPMRRPAASTALAAFAGLIVLAVGACTSPSPSVEPTPPEDPAAAMTPVPVPADGEEQVVSLVPGDTFAVALPANPSTGYTWGMTVPDVLEEEGAGSYASDAPPGMVGAGGTMTWRFRAVRPGEGELVLVYRRQWEEGTPPVQTVRYRVVVATP